MGVRARFRHERAARGGRGPLSAALTRAQARRLRLVAQLLAFREPRSPESIVEWFGALQAQDLGSVCWSLGVRSPGLDMDSVERALEDGAILRTWPMRGTVHLVPAVDARWMLEVAGVRALAAAERRRAQLGLDEATADRAAEVLGEALVGGVRMTRSDCLERLRAAGIVVDGQRGYHLLWYASQRGVTCFGPGIGADQTFRLLADAAPTPRQPTRDEALGLLALRYVRSHGPVGVHELARWTGLPLRDCRRGVEVAGEELVSVHVDGEPLLVHAEALADGVPGRVPARDAVILLPGFDELVLGYGSRDLHLDLADAQRIVPGANGVFRPTLVHEGRILGTWSRTVRRGSLQVSVAPLRPLPIAVRERLDRAAGEVGRFLGLPVRLQVG